MKLENEYIAIAFSRCHQNLKSANHIVVVLQSTAARKYKVQLNYFSVHQIILDLGLLCSLCGRQFLNIQPLYPTTGTAQREGLGGFSPPPHFFARIKIN